MVLLFYRSFMLFTYSKMTVLDCLKPLTLSAVGNDDRMFGGRDIINCQMPGPQDSL